MKYLGIYAILDTVAASIIGHPFLQRHDAAAVRLFHDLATTDKTAVGQHPLDHTLIRLGFLNLDNQIVVHSESQAQIGYMDHHTVITGKQWLDMQAATTNKPQLVNEA